MWIRSLMSAAMAAYARQAKDQELILWATEIKVRAERRAGEMLAQMPKNQGAKFNGRGPDGSFRQSIDVSAETLADVGVSPMQSSRWQALAAMPDERFESAVLTERKAQVRGLPLSCCLKFRSIGLKANKARGHSQTP